MSQITDDIRARINTFFEIDGYDEPRGDLPSGYFLKSRSLGKILVSGLETREACEAFAAGIFYLEDAMKQSDEDTEIDNRVEIRDDFEGDTVIVVDDAVVFGTFLDEDAARPHAATISRLLVKKNYYYSIATLTPNED